MVIILVSKLFRFPTKTSSQDDKCCQVPCPDGAFLSFEPAQAMYHQRRAVLSLVLTPPPWILPFRELLQSWGRHQTSTSLICSTWMTTLKGRSCHQPCFTSKDRQTQEAEHVIRKVELSHHRISRAGWSRVQSHGP